MPNNEKKIEELDKDLIDILKFQYQELGKERQRNTTISHAMMGALIPSSILAYLYFDGVSKLLSPLLVLAAYLIDKRLTYYNRLREHTMKRIEEEFEKQFHGKKEKAGLDFFVMKVVGLYESEENLPKEYKDDLDEFLDDSLLIRIRIIGWILNPVLRRINPLIKRNIKDVRVSDYLFVIFLVLLLLVALQCLKFLV